ncbi:uncharacterized protein J3R85_009685 [Psidium guajava]|nr:uncharacterized protein J3R85_009685 [Psidium guajava]
MTYFALRQRHQGKGSTIRRTRLVWDAETICRLPQNRRAEADRQARGRRTP